jgi:hypothetical protein
MGIMLWLGSACIDFVEPGGHAPLAQRIFHVAIRACLVAGETSMPSSGDEKTRA